MRRLRAVRPLSQTDEDGDEGDGERAGLSDRRCRVWPRVGAREQGERDGGENPYLHGDAGEIDDQGSGEQLPAEERAGPERQRGAQEVGVHQRDERGRR